MYTDDEDAFENTSPELSEKASETMDSIPERSKEIYLKGYQQFMDWCKTREDIDTASLSENVILAYLTELSDTRKASTLWKTYSILRTTISINHKVDLTKYTKVRAFLKQKSTGYQSKKSLTLTAEQINKFILEAPDDPYLATKAGLIVGVMGACGKQELYQVKVQDLEFLESAIIITIPDVKTNTCRQFTITGNFYDILKKYADLRPANADRDNFFLNFQKDRCTKQVIGINKFGDMPKQVAEYLGLPNFKLYTGHCFKRTSSKLLIDADGDITEVPEGNETKNTWIKLRNCHRDSLRRQIKCQKSSMSQSITKQSQKQMQSNLPYDNESSETQQPNWESTEIDNIKLETLEDEDLPDTIHFEESEYKINDVEHLSTIPEKSIQEQNKYPEVPSTSNISKQTYTNKKRNNVEQDNLYHFYMSMYEISKRMPPQYQHIVRNNVFQAVSHVEADYLQINHQSQQSHPHQMYNQTSHTIPFTHGLPAHSSNSSTPLSPSDSTHSSLVSPNFDSNHQQPQYSRHFVFNNTRQSPTNANGDYS